MSLEDQPKEKARQEAKGDTSEETPKHCLSLYLLFKYTFSFIHNGFFQNFDIFWKHNLKSLKYIHF